MLRGLRRWWYWFAICAVSLLFIAVSTRVRSLFALHTTLQPKPNNLAALNRHSSTISSSHISTPAMSSATSAKPLTFHTVQPKSQHTATIIFVHGLGDSGEGWLPVAKQLSKSDALSHVKWILPNAPERSISVNMGMKMPGWYDIYSFAKDELSGETRREDKKGMLESRDSIVAIVKQEIEAGIPEDRVVVGGFSQGAAMSLLVGITGPYKLAGIAVASGYMPLPLEIKDLANPHAAALPVWWAHGTRDPLIPYDSVDKSMSIARARLGMSNAQPGSTAGIEFHSYNIAHSADQAEIISLGQWVARVVPAK